MIGGENEENKSKIDPWFIKVINSKGPQKVCAGFIVSLSFTVFDLTV